MFKYYKIKRTIENNKDLYNLESFQNVNKMGSFFIKKLQNIILKSNNPKLIYNFARDVEKADISLLQDTLIKNLNNKYYNMNILCSFARDVKNANIKNIENEIFNYLSKNKANEDFANLIDIYVSTHKAINTQKLEELLLNCNSNNPEHYLNFVKNVEHCNLEKLQNKFIEKIKVLDNDLTLSPYYLYETKHKNVNKDRTYYDSDWANKKTKMLLEFKYLVKDSKKDLIDNVLYSNKYILIDSFIDFLNEYNSKNIIDKEKYLIDFIKAINLVDKNIKKHKDVYLNYFKNENVHIIDVNFSHMIFKSYDLQNEEEMADNAMFIDRFKNMQKLLNVASYYKFNNTKLIEDTVLNFKNNNHCSPTLLYLFAKNIKYINTSKLLKSIQQCNIEELNYEQHSFENSFYSHYDLEDNPSLDPCQSTEIMDGEYIDLKENLSYIKEIKTLLKNNQKENTTEKIKQENEILL